VPGHAHGVGHGDVVADGAVVRDVRVGHEQAVGADGGHLVALAGAPVNGDELAEVVGLADANPGLLALEAKMLGLVAHAGVGVDVVARAHGGVVLDLREGVKNGAVADFDDLFDDAVRPDRDVFAELGARMHDSGGMDGGRH